MSEKDVNFFSDTENSFSLFESDSNDFSIAENSNELLSNFSTTQKLKLLSLRNALKNRNNNIIIVSGPSGCLKTTFINLILKNLSLTSEYIEDITLYKSKLLSKYFVCLTDIDDLDYFIKN